MNYFFLYDSAQVHHIIDDTSDEIKTTLQVYYASVEQAEIFFTNSGIDITVIKEYFPERYPDAEQMHADTDINY